MFKKESYNKNIFFTNRIISFDKTIEKHQMFHYIKNYIRFGYRYQKPVSEKKSHQLTHRVASCVLLVSSPMRKSIRDNKWSARKTHVTQFSRKHFEFSPRRLCAGKIRKIRARVTSQTKGTRNGKTARQYLPNSRRNDAVQLRLMANRGKKSRVNQIIGSFYRSA